MWKDKENIDLSYENNKVQEKQKQFYVLHGPFWWNIHEVRSPSSKRWGVGVYAMVQMTKSLHSLTIFAYLSFSFNYMTHSDIAH